MQKWIDDSKRVYKILNSLSLKDLNFLAEKSGIMPSDNKDLLIKRLELHMQIQVPNNIDFSK